MALSESRRRVLLKKKQELLKQQLDAVAEEPVQERQFDPNVGLGEFVADRAKRGFGLGIGAPIDIVDLISRQTTGTALNPLAPDILEQVNAPPLAGETLADFFGFKGIKPPSANAQLAGRAVEEITAGAPFSAIPITRGASLLKNVLGNTALSGFSGLGGGIGQQATGSLGGEITGQVTGAVAPAILASKVNRLRNLRGNIKNLKEGVLNSEFLSTGRKQSIVKGLSQDVPINKSQFPDEVQDVVQGQVDEINRRRNVLSQVVDEQGNQSLRPTLATVTGSRVVRQREADVAARGTIEESERIRLDRSNQLSLNEFAESGVPVSDESLAVITRQRRKSLTREQASLDKDLLKAQNDINEVSVLNATDLESAGTELRTQRGIEATKLTDEATRRYNGARAQATQTPVELDASGTVALFNQYKKDPLFELAPQDLPNVFSRIDRLVKKQADEVAGLVDARGNPISVPEKAATKIDYEEYSAMRQAVNQDIQVELGRTVPNRRRIRALTRMKKRIDSMGKQIESQSPDLFKLDNDANKYYRDVVAPKLFRGINLKLGLGEDRLFNEKVIQQYWKPKGITNIRRFKSLYGTNETANAALEGGVLKLYKDAVAPNGVIDPVKHARFMNKFEANFNEFPKLKQMLNDKSAAVETLNLRAQELADNIDEINSSIWLKYKDFGGQEPSLIIKDALKNPRTMSRTVLGMPKNARESFAASVLSDVYESSRNAIGDIDPKKLDKLMLENGEAIQTALRHGFGATKARTHMKRLKVVSEAADILAENTVSVSSVGSGTRNINIGGFDTGIPITTAISQARAVQTGRTGIHYVLGVLSTQTGFNANRQMAEALEKKLLYDPDTSLEMIRMFREQQRTGVPNIRRMQEFVSKATGFIFGEGQVQRNIRAVSPRLGLEERTQLQTN